MKMRTLVTTILATTAMTSMTSTAVLADDSFKIVDEPLELTIQMNHARYPVYREDWPVDRSGSKSTD